MAKEINDYNSANGGIEGQAQPTSNLSPGVISSAAAVSAYTTGVGTPGFNTNIQTEQVLAVTAAQSHTGSKLKV
jgi:hypothetical protein